MFKDTLGQLRWFKFRHTEAARVAARHESGHALVASVLGYPFDEVYIQDYKRHRGLGGGVVPTPRLEAEGDVAALCRAILVDIAVHVTGVLGEYNWETISLAAYRLGQQNDLHVACGLMRAFAMIRPDLPDIGNEIFNAAWSDMTSAQWRTAIGKGYKLLLLSGGSRVPSESFKKIAQEHSLDLPLVRETITRIGV